MKDILCYNVDTDTEDGKLLARRFAVGPLPTLLWLAPDGSPEDQIVGYIPPDAFKKEIQRVRSGKDTVSDHRKQVEADKANVDKRFTLARKLKQLGDQDGHDAQIAEIRKLDPERKSKPMRWIGLEEILARINTGWEADQMLETKELAAFLAEEKHPEILFDGWNTMGRMLGFLAERAAGGGEAEKAKKLRAELRAAVRNAWKHCPTDQIAPCGASLAWVFYEARDEITGDDKAFALEVATRAAAAAEKEPDVLHTLACCLFMNGRKEDALKQIARCIELDPTNETWKERLAEFQK